MMSEAFNNKDCFGNELEIGDVVAVSGCSYATLTKCRVVRFSGKKISVSDLKYEGTQYISTMSKRSDQIALIERGTKVDAGAKLYTRKEVEHWRNDMVDSILALVGNLKAAPLSVILKGIEGMKTNG